MKAARAGQRFDDVENNLKRDYETPGGSSLGSDKARLACRATWVRADKCVFVADGPQVGTLTAMDSQHQDGDRSSAV